MQNQPNLSLLVDMAQPTITEIKRESVRALRARLRAEGRTLMTTDLPGDLIEGLDRLKESRGLRGRTPLIEEAVRDYLQRVHE